MIKKIAYIIIILTLGACSNSNVVNLDEMIISVQNNQIKEYTSIKHHNQIESEFNVLYFGPKINKIEIDNFKPLEQIQIEEYITETQNFSHPNILHSLRMRLTKPHEEQLSIEIDSSITYPIILNRSQLNKYHSRSYDTIIAHPLIIENVSDNFLEITYGPHVQIEVQAQDDKKDWYNITYPYQRFCGTGIYSHPIFPGEIVITSIPVFEGNHKTMARIKIFDYYSDEFQIEIDKSIFKSPFEKEKNR